MKEDTGCSINCYQVHITSLGKLSQLVCLGLLHMKTKKKFSIKYQELI